MAFGPPLAILHMTTAIRSTGASSFSPASPAARAGRSSWSADATGAPRAAAQGGKPFSHQQNCSILLTSPPGASCVAAPGSGSLLLTSRSREQSTNRWAPKMPKNGKILSLCGAAWFLSLCGVCWDHRGCPTPLPAPLCRKRGSARGDRSRALFSKGMKS